jgi:hypothetical protein
LIQIRLGEKKKPGRGAAGLFRGALFAARLLVREQHNNDGLSKVFLGIREKFASLPIFRDRGHLHHRMRGL